MTEPSQKFQAKSYHKTVARDLNDKHLKPENTFHFPVSAKQEGMRLDAALATLLSGYSRSHLQSCIKRQQVLVAGKTCRASQALKAGDEIVVFLEAPAKADAPSAQRIPLNLVYEDQALLVVNKPPGMVVHPAAGHKHSTLVNALLAWAPELEHLPRAGLIHRLDKDTSGLLAVAKTQQAYESLVGQMQERRIGRIYSCLVSGCPIAGGEISAPIARHPKNRKKMAVAKDGREAKTIYRIAERFPSHTLLRVQLITGRTHQIRVHLAHIGYRVFADPLYGGRATLPPNCSDAVIGKIRNFKRQALHAETLSLAHPVSGDLKEWSVHPPQDMRDLLDTLREHRNTLGRKSQT